MAAFKRGFLPVRQKAHNRQSRLAFEHRGEHRKQHRGAVVQKQRAHAAVLPERAQAAHLRRECQARPFRAKHQQHGQTQRAGHVPRGSLIGHAAQAVVVAHHALGDGGFVSGAAAVIERAENSLIPAQKAVEVVALHAQHGAVKHGVDVVRPALERAGRKAAIRERRQKRACHGGFSAARRGGRHQKFKHHNSPQSERQDSAPSACADFPRPARRTRSPA